MPNPAIIPKKSSIAGRIPTSDIAVGELVQNLADRCLYSKDASGTVYRIGTRPAPDRVWAFDISADGLTTYLGFLLYADFPNTGSVYDSESWEISRTIFNAAGITSQESSATGAWSNKANLNYA